MNLNEFFGRNIFEVLQELKPKYPVVEYVKIESDEFLKLPEKGFYLHAKQGNGIISDYRVYFASYEGFDPAGDDIKGSFKAIDSISDVETLLGPSVKDIRVVKIPGTNPTLPGKLFLKNGQKISAHSDDGRSLIYLHVKNST